MAKGKKPFRNDTETANSDDLLLVLEGSGNLLVDEEVTNYWGLLKSEKLGLFPWKPPIPRREWKNPQHGPVDIGNVYFFDREISPVTRQADFLNIKLPLFAERAAQGELKSKLQQAVDSGDWVWIVGVGVAAIAFLLTVGVAPFFKREAIIIRYEEPPASSRVLAEPLHGQDQFRRIIPVSDGQDRFLPDWTNGPATAAQADQRGNGPDRPRRTDAPYDGLDRFGGETGR